MQQITKEYIEDNRLRPHSSGYMILCPACGGNDCFESTDVNGRTHCFNCGTSFKLRGYRQEEEIGYIQPLDVDGIRTLYNEAIELYSGCIRKKDEDYLRRRGITEETAAQFRIGYCPNSSFSLYKHPLARSAGIADRRGNPSLRGRITFGYEAEGRWTDIRGRSENEEPKYRGLYNSSRSRGALYPFNLDRACIKAREKGYIIITEGEIKAVVADVYNFPCIALPGMASWRPYFVPDPSWRVVVLFDNVADRLGKLQINKAIERVWQRIPQALISTLPLEGQEKQDIDSFLMGKGDRVDRLQGIIDDAVPYQRYKALSRK